MLSPQTPKPSALQRRLTAYSSALAAGACAVAAAHHAEADIIYSGPVNVAVPATSAGGFVNLVTFAFGTTYASVNGGDSSAPALNLWGTTSSRAWLYPASSTVNRFVSDASNHPLELSFGAAINAISVYGTSTEPNGLTGTGNLWTDGSTGYLGFRFLSGATTLYGWAQVMVANGAPSSGNQMHLLGIAYDNTGAGLTAGQTSAVPEPGTVGLLALGAVGGTIAWRRRKAA